MPLMRDEFTILYHLELELLTLNITIEHYFSLKFLAIQLIPRLLTFLLRVSIPIPMSRVQLGN